MRPARNMKTTNVGNEWLNSRRSSVVYGSRVPLRNKHGDSVGAVRGGRSLVNSMILTRHALIRSATHTTQYA